MMTIQQYAQEMIAKYERYISNITYHLNNNTVSETDRQLIKQRIDDFNQVIEDFKVIS